MVFEVFEEAVSAPSRSAGCDIAALLGCGLRSPFYIDRLPLGSPYPFQMARDPAWSFSNRLKSSLGLFVFGVVFGILALALGLGAAAVWKDVENAQAKAQTAQGSTSSPPVAIYRRSTPGAADARVTNTNMQASGLMTFGSVLFAVATVGCFAGAVAVLALRRTSRDV